MRNSEKKLRKIEIDEATGEIQINEPCSSPSPFGERIVTGSTRRLSGRTIAMSGPWCIDLMSVLVSGWIERCLHPKQESRAISRHPAENIKARSRV
ncbi:MAG: hypothetical protein V1844_13095 [Pseudomonadota bacterium]